MDQDLKQRLIGAIVITAVAAIFVPMLFDDPVEESGKLVNELALPEAPTDSFEETASRLPGERGGKDESEDYEPVEEEQSGEYEFNPDPYGPVEDAGFEPEPFVEEPVYEPEVKPVPMTTAPAASKPQAAAVKSVSPRLEAAMKAPDPRSAENAYAAVSGVTGWYIQLGSFSQKENAFSLRDKLRAQGFPASIDEVNTGGGKSYRLVVGPEHDKNKAQSIQTQLDNQHHTKSLLVAVGETGAEKPSMTVAKTPSPSGTRSVTKSDASAAPTASALVRWYIQLGSFTQQENAYSLRDKLRTQGFPVSIDAVTTANGKSYRLRVGPELDKKRAEAMQAKLEKQNSLNSLLVSE